MVLAAISGLPQADRYVKVAAYFRWPLSAQPHPSLPYVDNAHQDFCSNLETFWPDQGHYHRKVFSMRDRKFWVNWLPTAVHPLQVSNSLWFQRVSGGSSVHSHFVYGLCSDAMQQCLLAEADLTLGKAMELTHSMEPADNNIQLIKG